MDTQTAEYLKNLSGAAGLYQLAVLSKAGLLNSYWEAAAAFNRAIQGGLLGTDAAIGGAMIYGGLPVVTMAGVFAALGAGYAAAREIVADENAKAGFSQGFVMGLLGWNGHQIVNLFGRQRVLRIHQPDEQLNVIRVNSYNKALAAGYTAALALAPAARQGYLSKLRTLAGHPSTGVWNRDDQVSFVIELATAALRNDVLKP